LTTAFSHILAAALRSLRNATLVAVFALSVALGLLPSSSCAAPSGAQSGFGQQANRSASVLLSSATGSAKSKTHYLYADTSSFYAGWVNGNWVVADPLTDRVFAADPGNNQVIVATSSANSRLAAIPVPGAFGIDETVDHKTIYVGTLIGDIYAIDPVKMEVTQRFRSSQIGPYGFQALSVRTLKNGELALLGYPFGASQPGIPSVDGYSSLAIWNPSEDTITIYGQSVDNSGLPNCIQNIGAFTVTGDHSLVVEASIDGDGTLCTIDPVSGKVNQTTTLGGYTNVAAATPDGKSVIVWDLTSGHDVEVLDTKSLTLKLLFPAIGNPDTDSPMIVSQDSKTLYTSDSNYVYAYDIASGILVGWTSNLILGQFEPLLQAIGNNGMIAGVVEQGVGFIDTTVLATGVPGVPLQHGYLIPSFGPATGGTSTQWGFPSGIPVSSVYFGPNPSSSFKVSDNQMTATSSHGAPGPVDVLVYTTNGDVQVSSMAFSYGPYILETVPDSSASEGDATGVIYGMGFGPLNETGIPPDLEVTVDGKRATIQKFFPCEVCAVPPFWSQRINYAIPPGTAGNAPIKVTNSTGSTTLANGIHYLPALRKYPRSGAVLAQGVYDAKRALYYFTDTALVQVFSRRLGEWLTPISAPASASGRANRLWGIAISPDCSKLVVSDVGAAEVYLFDPEDTKSVKSFPTPGGIKLGGPSMSNSGMAYFPGFKLDTITGKFTKLSVPRETAIDSGIAGQASSLGPMGRTALTFDGARLFYNTGTYITSADTLTGAHFETYLTYGAKANPDLSLAPDQTHLFASQTLFDSNLDTTASLTADSWQEGTAVSYLFGAKLSPDGSLLFQPSTSGIDVFDGRNGALRTRIALPVPLSHNYDALVSDGLDNLLVAITGTSGDGIAIVDLTSLHEPPPAPYVDEGSRAWRAPHRLDLSPAQLEHSH
jgi:hypothetical protein